MVPMQSHGSIVSAGTTICWSAMEALKSAQGMLSNAKIRFHMQDAYTVWSHASLNLQQWLIEFQKIKVRHTDIPWHSSDSSQAF